jgi:oxygen-dependent protoporphyrinogen oxidase
VNSPAPNTATTVDRPTAAVVGAGLSGLTAAYRLQLGGWDVRVFESRGEVGGRVQSVHKDGYIMDTGASAIGASYSAYLRLAEELDLHGDIVPSSPYFGIYRKGHIHLMRLDRMIWSGLATNLLSFKSKLRLLPMVFDLLRALRRGQLDYSDMRKAGPLDVETAWEYARRLLNPEIDTYLCGPIVRTMLMTDTRHVSKVELFSGLANIFASRIYALRGGQARFAEVLAGLLQVRLRHEVTKVSQHGKWVEVEIRDASGLLQTQKFDACVVSCPLPVAARICPDHHESVGVLSNQLNYTRAITVSVGTRVQTCTPAFLIQMPELEDAEVALLFVEHNKAIDRAPPGRGLIGCDWEAEASARWFERSDEDIRRRTLETVFRVFPELKRQIEFVEVTRWPHALPHTRVGSYCQIGEFNAELNPCARVQFAGDFMSAAGQNTAVEFGNRAAANLLRHHLAGTIV